MFTKHSRLECRRLLLLSLRLRREVRTNSPYPRRYRTAVHHVISTTSRSQAASNFVLFLYASASCFLASTAAACCRTSPILQVNQCIHSDLFFRTRYSRLQWHLQRRGKPTPEWLQRIHWLPTALCSHQQPSFPHS